VFLISWTLAVNFFPRTLPEFDAAGGAFWTLGILASLGLFLSVLLHELGHAVVARRYGIPVRGIRLFVFGGVAELGGEPKQPRQEILIALGGPVVTLLLIGVYELGLSLVVANSDAAWQLSGGLLTLHGGSRVAAGAAALCYYLGFINTVLLVFNLIPAFPLDGGRVLRGIVWSATGDYLRSTRIAGGFGIGFAWLLFLGGFLMMFSGNLFGGIWFFFLGMFLQNAAQSSIAYAQLQQLLGGVRVADMMARQPITVDARLPLRTVADDFFLHYPYKAYPVVSDGRFLWDQLNAGQVVARQQPLPVVQPQEPVVQALRKLAESGHSRLPVVADGALVGLLCRRDVMDFLEIRGGLAQPRDGEARVGAGVP
jgi:Zn-dependent protease/CBS domain-containing protein